MLFRILTIAVVAVAVAAAQVTRFSEHILQHLGNERIAGYALAKGTLATWGDRLSWRRLPQVGSRVAQVGGRTFSEGGCLLDVDGDALMDLVVNENGPEAALVWFRAPRWTRYVIDTGIDAPDIIPVTLFGRRGVLLIQKRIQVRFYAIPADPTARWPSQEIYSFYSPSRQGGLKIADIDGDGLLNILAGNYWIRSAESFDMPWRLFAIEPWNETPDSAMLRLAYGPLTGAAPELLIVQDEMPAARMARFEKPADPRQLWIEHAIEVSPALNQPNSLDVADFDGDGRPDILVAENGGAGRMMVLKNAGGGRFVPEVISHGMPVRFARAVDINGDRRPDILVIRKDAVAWFENLPARGGELPR
jgi:hypothetical protein